MAAGLYTSHATSRGFIPFDFRCAANLPENVVLPEPWSPAIRITLGEPVKFIGVGEKIEDLEEFNPKGFVSRMLGMGDIEALLEKAKDAINEEDAQDMIDEYKMPFTNILSNPIELNAWMEVNAEEGLIGTPTFMIFNPEGHLKALQAGILPTTSLEKYIKANS